MQSQCQIKCANQLENQVNVKSIQLIWPHSILKDEETELLLAVIALKHVDWAVPPEDVAPGALHDGCCTVLALQGDAHFAVSVNHDTVVEAVQGLVRLSGPQDQLVDPRLVPGSCSTVG